MDGDSFLEVTWSIAMRVWWSYVWRATVFGVLLGGLAGVIAGLILVLADGSKYVASAFSITAHIFVIIVVIIVGISVMRSVLRKDYKNFSLRLVNDQSKSSIVFIEVTWGRATKVWWGLAWRVLLFSCLIGFPIGVVLGLGSVIVGMSKGVVAVVTQITGFIIGIPIGIVITKSILKKQFSDFRIALVKK